MRFGVHGGDVDLLVGEHRDHVAQQPLAVPGAQEDVHRVEDAVRFPPAHLDHPVGLLALHRQQVVAVGAVHGNATPLGDEAHHLVTGHRPAAGRHVGEQVAHPLDGHVAALRRLGARRHERQLLLRVVAEQGLGLVDHMAGAQVAGAQGGEHVVAALQVQLRRQGVQVDAVQGQARDLALQDGAALGDVHVPVLALEPLLDARPRRGGGHVTQRRCHPVAAGATLLGGENLHLLTGVEIVVERHDVAVHLGAPAAVPHFGVDVVGEIHRRGAGFQIHHMAVRGEHVDPVADQAVLELVDHGVGVVAQLVVPLQHLAQPGDALLVGAALAPGLAAFLVAPVGAHAELRLFVHVEGADLHLQHLALRAHHGGVQALVAVVLGAGDVVVELLGHVLPQRVDDAQGGVAVAHFAHQHAHRAHVVDLAEIQMLFLHLPPDAVDVLGAAVHLGALDAVALQMAAQAVDHLVDIAFPVEALFIQQLGDLLVGARLQVAERQILQLPFQLAHAQAVGQRRVDVEDLAGHLLLAFRVGLLHRANDHGPLGQLDQGHAHVVDHRQQHLADVIQLAVLLAEHRLAGGVQAGADGGHAQHALDQARHRLAEVPGHFRQGQLPFAHRPVQHRRGQRLRVGPQVGEHIGHLQADGQTALTVGPQAAGGFAGPLAALGHLAGALQNHRVAHRHPGIELFEPCVPVPCIQFSGLLPAYRYHGLSFNDDRTRRSIPHARCAGTCPSPQRH